jgi:hypothetical protein
MDVIADGCMTARVAAYIEADRDRRIPNAAWQAAFKCILDLLGCAGARQGNFEGA